MANTRRLTELGMAPSLAKEVADQIDTAAGAPITPPAAIATADATDPATTMALVNICKAKINEIIAAL